MLEGGDGVIVGIEGVVRVGGYEGHRILQQYHLSEGG